MLQKENIKHDITIAYIYIFKSVTGKFSWFSYWKLNNNKVSKLGTCERQQHSDSVFMDKQHIP